MDSQAAFFFTQPATPAHRHYELLRAIFVEHLDMQAAALRFNYRYDTVRTLVAEFRQLLRAGQTPPFSLLLNVGVLVARLPSLQRTKS